MAKDTLRHRLPLYKYTHAQEVLTMKQCVGSHHTAHTSAKVQATLSDTASEHLLKVGNNFCVSAIFVYLGLPENIQYLSK